MNSVDTGLALPTMANRRALMVNSGGFAVFLGDALALLLALFLGWGVRWWSLDLPSNRFFAEWGHLPDSEPIIFYVGLAAIALSRFFSLGHYSRRRPFWDELHQTLWTLLGAALIHTTVIFLAKWTFSRAWLLSTWTLALILVPTLRVLVKKALLRLGRWQIRTVIIGVGQNALEAAAALDSDPLMGHEIIAFLDPQAEAQAEATIQTLQGRSLPLLALGEEPAVTLKSLHHPQVVVALESGGLHLYQPLLERLHIRYTDINIVPAIRGLPLVGMEASHFFRHEVLLLKVRNNLAQWGPRILKRTFDLLVSAIGLMTLSPLFAYIGWQIHQTGGSVFFGHQRVGLKGKPFYCYKFRSMVPNAEQVLQELLNKNPEARAEWEHSFKLKNDPRISPIGAFLRRTSLDELPQLWNVLLGDMSLVGPRPVIEAELERYADQKKYYRLVRPGISGLWQISGRSDVDYAERVALDTWYIKNWTLWYDVAILFMTAKTVLAGKGAY